MPIDGIIFDMDGVLCDSEPYICEAACLMFERVHKQKVQPEDFVPFVGTGEDRYLGGVAEKYGVKLSMPANKVQTYDIYLEIIKGRLPPLPGAVAFIDLLHRSGKKRAVATSADRVKLDGNLAQIGLPPDKFNAVVTGDDVQRKKPDPQIFQLAAQKLGLEPSRCMVVEDAPNGVRAAKAAGCLCLGLTSSFSEAMLRAEGVDFIAPNLRDLPKEVGKAIGVSVEHLPVLIRAHELLKTQDSFAAIEHITGYENPRVSMNTFADMVVELYWKHRDLPDVIAIGRAGVQFGLTTAARVAKDDPQTAQQLRGVVRAIAYNVASFAWPGWNESDLEISKTDAALGLDAAKTSLRLVQEMNEAPIKLSRGHWIVGAYHLSGGSHRAAIQEFEKAVQHAKAANQIGDERLAAAYVKLTELLESPTHPKRRDALESAKTSLAQAPAGDELVAQIDTALRVFLKN